jgi:uncharacterized protein (DUF433 family)
MTHDRIEQKPGTMDGRPVIKGTRLPVEFILRRLASGRSQDELLLDYPHLVRDDLEAVLMYAADHIAHEGFVAVA